MTTPVKKTDSELQIVWGEVYAPDVPDSQGDFMVADEIRKMGHNFIKSNRSGQVDLMHNNELCGCSIVESFIARDDDPLFIPGSWVVGLHVSDTELWAAIKSGEYNGFSMQAMAQRVPADVTMDVPDKLAGVTDMADGHEHSFTVKYDRDGNFLGGSTGVAKSHFHSIQHGTASEEAMGHTHRFSFVERVRAHAKHQA